MSVLRCLLTAGLTVALLTPPGQAEELKSLPEELYRQTPDVIRYLNKKGYKNVGVLKFRVQRGADEATDSAGPLNLAVTRQLEISLALRTDVREPLGILRNASAVAAGIKGASHLTADGRKALFTGRYPLAWGEDKVEADAFLTGVVRISPNLRTLTVGILAFDRVSGLEKVLEFNSASEVSTLVSSGESFLLRGAFDDPKAVEAAARTKAKEEVHPLNSPDAPVALEIRYDEKNVKVEFRDGRAFVAEPQEGQKVTLVLSRAAAAARGVFGVVLKVNGENTLFRQRLPDVECRKWVLEPNDRPTPVRGFQTPDRQAETFAVRSREESARKEVYYGSDVGTIALTVFRERQAEPEPKDLPPKDLPAIDEDEDLAAVKRGVLPQETPRSLAALRTQLRGGIRTKGLIEGGARIGSDLETVKFKPDPTPVMAATIKYYRP